MHTSLLTADDVSDELLNLQVWPLKKLVETLLSHRLLQQEFATWREKAPNGLAVSTETLRAK